MSSLVDILRVNERKTERRVEIEIKIYYENSEIQKKKKKTSTQVFLNLYFFVKYYNNVCITTR